MKKFEYKQAIIAALSSRKNEVIVSLIEELLQRGVLNLILRKMNTNELETLMNFIEKCISVGKFQDTLIETLERVLDERNDKNFEGIGKILEEEIDIEKNIEEICGSLESIRNCQEFNL